MSKIMVELEWEAVDSIIVQQVKNVHEDLSSSLQKRKKKNSTNAIFHNNRKKDVKEIQEHLEGFEKVIRYFGGTI